MGFEEVLVGFGVDAVRQYKSMAGLHQDNALPEVFLHSFIAMKLHEHTGRNVHIERLYSVMARELELDLTAPILTGLGGLRADLAIYDGAKPSTIVEFKIFDESCMAAAITQDLDKANLLVRNGASAPQVYVAMLICETSESLMERRINELETGLQRPIHASVSVRSGDGNWSWRFGCARGSLG